MLSARDFDKWFKNNQTEGLKFANYTNPVVMATLCYQTGILDGLFKDMNENQIDERYNIMFEILGVIRTFEPKELEAIFRYCHSYHYAYRQAEGNHITTSVAIESDDKVLSESGQTYEENHRNR